MKAARDITLGALSLAVAFNTIEVLVDPDGVWWFTARSVAAGVFTVAAVTWVTLWLRERRSTHS